MSPIPRRRDEAGVCSLGAVVYHFGYASVHASRGSEAAVFDIEFDYFKAHQDELVKKYRGKSLVIIGTQVLGAYASDLQAYIETIKDHAPGTFMIQKCIPGPTAYTVTVV